MGRVTFQKYYTLFFFIILLGLIGTYVSKCSLRVVSYENNYLFVCFTVGKSNQQILDLLGYITLKKGKALIKTPYGKVYLYLIILGQL